MAQKTGIEWTETSLNCVRGCSPVSEGCQRCYAARIAARLSGEGMPYEGLAEFVNGVGKWNGEVRFSEKALLEVLRWQDPRLVFVNSMSDMFHKKLTVDEIGRIFAVMNRARQHVFQILTKRSKRLAKIHNEFQWTSNIWMGVSVELAKHMSRIDDLRATNAAIKFLSLEPLLGPLPNLDLTDIDWVIVGGESGPGARPMEKSWVLDIRDQCLDAGVRFFFKQWGGVHKKENGRLLDARTWDEMPPLPDHFGNARGLDQPA